MAVKEIKEKSIYVCTECGYESAKWQGRCPDCGNWNTLVEETRIIGKEKKGAPAMQREASPVMALDTVNADESVRYHTGMEELDRVLGGGIVPGAAILVCGDPGIGKSTVLLQMCRTLEDDLQVLYVSGEESARQIKLRANRLGASGSGFYVLSENDMTTVEKRMEQLKPHVMVVDSIQTMYLPELASAPGSVSQVRESASILMRLAKAAGVSVFLVGHVTKEGSIAGPRVLEHMVDAVLYFEGDRENHYRLLRAVKNRFGSVNELGMFEMQEAGMQEVTNASEALLSERAHNASGSVVMCAMEGTRPLLTDVQALVSNTVFGNPRRMASGVDQGRLALLLAVLEKRVGIRMYDQDVYINIAGGMNLTETAADLALCAAVASSRHNQPIPQGWAVMGEVGLAGELRSVSHVERRLSECMRLGFDHAVIPRQNLRGARIPEGMHVHAMDTVTEALGEVFGWGKNGRR